MQLGAPFNPLLLGEEGVKRLKKRSVGGGIHTLKQREEKIQRKKSMER